MCVQIRSYDNEIVIQKRQTYFYVRSANDLKFSHAVRTCKNRIEDRLSFSNILKFD